MYANMEITTRFPPKEDAMVEQFHFRRLGRMAVLAASAFLMLSCSLLSLPIPSGSDTGADSGGGEAGTPEIPLALLTCPEANTTATLTFGHDISWGLPGVGMFGLKLNGSYQINVIRSSVTQDPALKLGIYNISTGPIPVTVTAKEFKGCTDGQGKTNMRAIVTGTCINGTLTLYIQEYYEAASVTIMCGEKKDQKVEIPIPVGAMEQPVVWAMPVGTTAGSGATKDVEFSGEGGSGGMTYIFSMP
jgi:hypothetical protein